ncbi:trimeric intracellular cation channel family protein [Parachitinimonas caeni]|uniref:TRIC cation channel family protein n=1 Tax=Parachitinimonas caeni TaxID=3031301 RepID=A0ABT7DUB2_9NEIS|nr:TRIC cation channel family protein [Parachitinimonas caeni]MDK2123660.1 TRIC cation channel family protein [Parachitinimonas caeni]
MEWLQALLDMDGLFLVGTVSFTISGYLVGVRHKFDLLGVLIVALLTAIGGGIVRDMMLNRIPLVFHDGSALYTIGVSLLASRVFRLSRRKSTTLYRLFVITDSIGLVAFSLAGAEVAIHYGLNLFGVLAVSFISAVGGGIVRDMMVNEVPFILHRDFYGTVALVCGGALYLAAQFGWHGPALQWSLFAAGLALRLFAHSRDLRLPQVEQPD